MKKLLCLLLCMAMLISLFPAAIAEESIIENEEDKADNSPFLIETEAEVPSSVIPVDEEQNAASAAELSDENASNEEMLEKIVPEEKLTEGTAPEAEKTEVTVIAVLRQPLDAEVIDGVAFFTVVAEAADEAELQYQWQRCLLEAGDEDEENTWENLEGETSNALMLSAENHEIFTFSYRCMLSCGEAFCFTDEAVVLQEVLSAEEENIETGDEAEPDADTAAAAASAVAPGEIVFSESRMPTADEAIRWAADMVGQHVGVDDGSGYYQCVEFIQAYYAWMGVDPVSGNAYEYAYNYLPEGWTRTPGGTPQRGDILVYLQYSEEIQPFGFCQ